MEQTWFDLPVESRLTEVWPRGLLKKTKMVPVKCKPADMSSPMPYWNLPVVPMDQKMPLLPGPKDLYHLSRSKLGKKLWACEDSEFSLNEFIKKEIFNAYEILHDPNLARYLHRPKIVRRLKELGLVDSDLGVMCNLRDFNYYRRYLAFVHTNAINKLYKKQFIHGDKALDLVNLCTNLEKQDAKQRVIEEIDKRHSEVFKELANEQKKKSANCARRLRRVSEVYEKKKMDKEAKRIAVREAGKDFTKKVKENLYYANAQLRQHKLDTMRKWRKQNIEKTALFEEREKKKQDDMINKKTEWFQNKIKHQEKRVLQETQINVLMDHEFSSEYKKYLKFIKRENYKNPPERDAEPVYGDTSESEVEDSDLLNQLRLFTRAGYQMQRGSFISKVQARKSVAKLANSTGRSSNVDFVQVRRMSEKFVKEKLNKGSRKQSLLDALINSSILRLLSPSLQDVFKKSERKWRKGKKVQAPQKTQTSGPPQQIHEQTEPVVVQFVQEIQQTAPAQGTATQPSATTQQTAATQQTTTQLQAEQQPTSQPIVRLYTPQTTQPTPQPPMVPAQSTHQNPPDPAKRATLPSMEMQDSLEDLESNAMGGGLGMLKDSEIEIRPPNKSIPPPPICHLNVYRYFDRILGKVILEYVTRVLLPKFPEIFNRCYWVSKAEGLPEDVTLRAEQPPCNPEEDSLESVSECMDKIQKACDKKMSPYMLLLSESPDIRLFRHKYNGIGEITCSESLVDNYMVQSSPHPQHILDYIHWRADWILNYPTPKTYQEIYDLKYVIGVMKSIECPVFQPIYKLWEITNDINLNPDVIEKFNLYMEKKKEQKPMIELNPLAIAVKNVKKTMNSLYMDHKAKSAVDDYCFQDPFRFPSELFRLAYLKRPVDPKIWKILDDLLDKTKRAPDTTECLQSLEYKFRQSLSEKTEEFEEIQLKAPECLFVDPRDYAEELRKAKEKAEAERQPPTRLRFGITEFIPFIENALFGKEKGPPLETPVLEEDQKDHGDAKVKKPSALRFSLNRRKSSKLRSSRTGSARGSKIAPQRKETNLAEKLQDDVPGGKKKKRVTVVSTTDNDGDESKPTSKENKKTNEESSEDDDENVNKEGAKDDSVFFDTGDGIKPSKAKSDKSSKGDKKKDKKDKSADKLKKKEKEQKNKRKITVEQKISLAADRSIDGTKKKKDDVLTIDPKKKEKVKIVGLPVDQDDSVKERETMRTKSMSIMKTDQTAGYKSDLNVSFKSKTYIDPHLLKTLDVDDLKKSKERAPTPHSSFVSLDIPGIEIEEGIEPPPPPIKKDVFKTSLIKMIPCTTPLDSDESIKKQESINDVTAIRRTIEPIIQSDVLDKEMVLNVISAEEEEEEEEKSMPEIDSDLERLRDFVSGKIPHKHVVTEKKKAKESQYEPIPVPPIINKSLLARRRIIKRPLANILRKIYGWVMTTVIRRRLLISYGLPPKIRKECFYNKKYNPSEIDMARGLAKLILEEQSEFYPFAVLEPYIETILEQTMDSTKRFDFTKRVIRMEMPLNDEGLSSLQQFLQESEQDLFFKRARVRRLRKFSHCVKMRTESIWFYADNWASNSFNPREWEDIFRIPKLEIQGQMCAKKKHIGKKRRSLQQQKSAFISYGGDSPEESESSGSSSEEKVQLQIKHQQNQGSSKVLDTSNRNKSKSTGWSKTSVWLQTAAVKRPDAYDEWKPGFIETKVPSKQKILEIIINKTAEIVPSITEINDDMRKEFEFHKLQRRWLEKERQLRFITHLNIFNPVLPPVAQDRKLMKFIQSPKYPFHGTFMSCETFTERKSHPQDEVINIKSSIQSV